MDFPEFIQYEDGSPDDINYDQVMIKCRFLKPKQNARKIRITIGDCK
jgi:hypothetical protein